MNVGDPAAAPGHLEAGMFHGPARLGPLMGLLRRVPFPITERILAALAIADGVVRRGRFRRASTWAADRGARGWERWRIALALLANHGRFVAEEALLRGEGPDELRRRVVVLGEEHLRTLSGGAMLLGFHLGPPKSWLHLRALGHPVRFAGRLETAARDRRWQPFLDAGIAIRLPEGDAGARLRGLHRMRGLLQDGALVYLTADGPFGHEAFRIDLRGGPLIVRAGWLALRRATGAPTLPVFSFREGNRRGIVIHPPLPRPDGDAVRDSAACRAALTPLVEEYVNRFPTQCRWVAMPRWPADPAPPANAK
jgi:lauroyl/myristoyl acyltransferase